jgi:hypothetical protein
MSHAGKAPRLGLVRKDVPTPMSHASATTAFNPHEIVNLMTRYYQLLSKMRYFPESYIKYAPHDPPVDVEYALSLGIEPQAIELLQLLPYVEGLDNEDEFIMHGSFADFRQQNVLEQSRDPKFVSPDEGFDGENGEYVRPWVLALTEFGNLGSILYYNTRNGKLFSLFLCSLCSGTDVVKVTWCLKVSTEGVSIPCFPIKEMVLHSRSIRTLSIIYQAGQRKRCLRIS